MKKMYLFLSLLLFLGGYGLRAETTDVTFKFVDDKGSTQHTSVESLTVGDQITAPTNPFVTYNGYTSKNTGGAINLATYTVSADDEITIRYSASLYQMSNDSRGGWRYIYCNGKNVVTAPGANVELSSVWELIPAKIDGSVFFKNRFSGEYIGRTASGSSTVTTAAPTESYSIAPVAGSTTYTVKNVGGNDYAYFHIQNGGTYPIVGWTADDNASKWTFNTIEIPYSVIYECYDPSGTLIKKTAAIATSASHTVAAPTIGGCTMASITFNGTTVANGASITISSGSVVKVNYEYPFKTTVVGEGTDFPADANWYFVSLRAKHLKYNGTAPTISGTTRPVNKGDITDGDLWCFEGNYVDGFKMYNKAVGIGKVLWGNQPIPMADKSATTIWTIDVNGSTTPSGYGVTFRKGLTGNSYLNDVSSALGFYSNINDAGSKVQFASYAEMMSSMTITYEYTYGGKTVGTNKVTYKAGDPFTAPALTFYTIDSPITGTADADKTVQVPCTEKLPFKTTTIVDGQFADNTVWYQMRAHSNNRLYCSYDASKTQTTTNTTNSVADESLWCYVGTAFDGIRMYNRAAGASKPLTKGDATGNFAYCTEDANTAKSLWAISESTKSTGNPCFKLKDGSTTFLNQQGDALKYWGSADEGSTFLFTNVADLPKTNMSTQDYVGGYTAADLSDLKTAHAAYILDPNSVNFATLRNLIQGLVSKTKIAMKFGYYRIINTSRNSYLTMGLLPGCAPIDGKSLSQIWKFEEVETGSYKISCNGEYLGAVAQSTQLQKTDAANAGIYIVVDKGSAGVAIQKKDGNQYENIHTQGTNLLGWIVSATPDPSAWYLKEVPAFSVPVGTTGYASFSASVPTIIPADVEVSYASAAGANSLTMTSITDGVVSASEGVVLYSETAKSAATSYTFFATDGVAGTSITGNVLSNTASAEADAGTDCFVLSKPSGSAIGFHKAASTLKIPVNKAFYRSQTNPSRGFSIGGGDDEVTSIEGVTSEDGKSGGAYYDLSGRRANSFVKGGVYIHNGKKVIK